MLLKIFVFIFCFFISFCTFAKDITLSADNQIEYHQKSQKLVAKGNAVATKDDMTIKSSTLIGFYNPKNKNKISRVEAHQNVFLSSPQAQAFGNNLVYSLAEDTIILSGTPARIKTEDSEITSKGNITYFPSKQMATAKDDIIAQDAQGNKIYADLMTAYFIKDQNSNLILNKIDITQNLKIVSKDAVITAKKGTYFAQSGKIFLYDDVVINQNGNILKGSKAQTNLNTGISKILSGQSSGRVHGVFKEKKKE